jgi:hypothetical protein
MITRRELCAGAAAVLPAFPASSPGWTPAWDRALIDAAAASQEQAWDPAERLVKRRLGGDYSYHSGLRSAVVHPTRESLDYALLMLEAGGDARARRAEQAIARF